MIWVGKNLAEQVEFRCIYYGRDSGKVRGEIAPAYPAADESSC